jgi:Sugar (pentulose and hexulose) kinases
MAEGYLLGLDIGSSSIKASLVNTATAKVVASGQSPKEEMPMLSVKAGWAEQDPEGWWTNTVLAVREALASISSPNILSIGIAYQMHGLVLVGKDHKPLRPSIIWCDSRAVEIGNQANKILGEEFCLQHLLNSPGNFTASKLRWVRENEPECYSKVFKFMLPGDYIAMKLTGEIVTTETGLSEGIFWDFKKQELSKEVLNYFDIHPDLIPKVVPVFSEQGTLRAEAAKELGLTPGIKVGYRSGDQPNNAFSLNVLNPGETAATAGTSGVIYSVTDRNAFDQKSRVNTFVHVNSRPDAIRNGVLLCINGTGIANSWIRKIAQSNSNLSYEEMNRIAAKAPIGSDGLIALPFGNGAERVLENKMISASMHGLSFNTHSQSHWYRATQEGIVFALKYGFEIMNQMGVATSVIRAGSANLFLSPVFREAFVNSIGAPLELLETDGAKGAALGGGVGAGVYSSVAEAFQNITRLELIEPEDQKQEQYTSISSMEI